MGLSTLWLCRLWAGQSSTTRGCTPQVHGPQLDLLFEPRRVSLLRLWKDDRWGQPQRGTGVVQGNAGLHATQRGEWEEGRGATVRVKQRKCFVIFVCSSVVVSLVLCFLLIFDS